MAEKVINFSHIYPKLLDGHNDVVESAILLDVFKVRLESLSKEFLEYDTDNGKYELPNKGTYLMLLFKKPHEDYVTGIDLFTTLRRYVPIKEAYYRSQIGKLFEVVITREP